MGEVVGAGLVSHVPTIMLPEEVRLEINDGREISLVTGLRRLRSEVLDRLRPDTIVVMDTHWEVTFEHVVTGHERRSGSFTSGELPRGMRQVPYDFLVLGEVIGHAVARLDRRVVLLASGGLTHRFFPFKELRKRESSSLENIYSPEARAADEHVLDLLRAGNHRAVIDWIPEYKKHGPEGKFGHYLI